MSTPGKVLVAIITIAILGAVLLTAAVAKLNREYMSQIAAADAQIGSLGAQSSGVLGEIEDLKRQLVQADLDFNAAKSEYTRQLKAIQARIVPAQAELAEVIEEERRKGSELRRSQASVDNVQTALERHRRDRREAEERRDQALDDFAQILNEFEAGQQRLIELRADFERLDRENFVILQRLQAASMLGQINESAE